LIEPCDLFVYCPQFCLSKIVVLPMAHFAGIGDKRAKSIHPQKWQCVPSRIKNPVFQAPEKDVSASHEIPA
jgi:hypothetical protein